MKHVEKRSYIFIGGLVGSCQISVKAGQAQHTPDAEKTNDRHKDAGRGFFNCLKKLPIIPGHYTFGNRVESKWFDN